MTNLTKFDIALIGVKLLAVYMAIVVIETLPNWIMTAGMIMTPPNSIALKLGLVLLLAVTIIIPILLWILSKISFAVAIKVPFTVNDHSVTQAHSLIKSDYFHPAGMTRASVFINQLPNNKPIIIKLTGARNLCHNKDRDALKPLSLGKSCKNKAIRNTP